MRLPPLGWARLSPDGPLRQERESKRASASASSPSSSLALAPQALSKLFHPHGDLAKIAPETFQKVWEKLDDAKEAAEMDVTMKSLVEGTQVVAINDENSGDYLTSSFTLIDFYAPWCGHCQTFAPLFAEAAAELSARTDGTEKVVLATTDGTAAESLKLHDTMRVDEYPAMRWVVDGEWMEVTPDMMAHKKNSVLKWVEKHTKTFRETGVKFENALDWVTQTRFEKSASEISDALGLGGSATALRKLGFVDFIALAKEKNLKSLKLKKGRMLDKKRWKRAVKSLDTMAPGAGGGDDEEEEGGSAASGSSAKVDIDMDEL